MLIERDSGYAFVPLDYWLVFFLLGLLTSLGIGKASWPGLLASAAASGLVGLMALNTTYVVTRGPRGSLSVRRGWRRTEVEVGGASVQVRHAFKSYHQVVLSVGIPIAGEMLLGRCIRVAGRIASMLDVPLSVPRELQAQHARERRTLLWVLLLPVGALVLGSMLWLLARR